MNPTMTIVVATGNRGKLAEIRAVLAPLPVEVLSMLEALEQPPSICENGETFEENALIKARRVAGLVKAVTLADDSGLEVDALGGRPGVRSARFAGDGSTDAQNNAELLRCLEEVDDDARSARFRCAIALIDPWQSKASPTIVEGRCEGSIAHKPSGTGGFGYDPLFVVKGDGRTMAELSEEEKNRISHRAVALHAIMPKLRALVKTRSPH